MQTIEVQVGQVEQLAARLQAVGEQLEGAGRSLAGAATASGHPGLTVAVERFRDAWRHGLGRTSGAAVSAATQLRAAAEHYRAVDEGVAAGFDGGTCR
jgi:hypothetical protein